eukprot:m.780748 g.780748  ORF g.780748 m.780748 type:complete len:201 (+) comp23283_c2_seq5:247-849(+)
MSQPEHCDDTTSPSDSRAESILPCDNDAVASATDAPCVAPQGNGSSQIDHNTGSSPLTSPLTDVTSHTFRGSTRNSPVHQSNPSSDGDLYQHPCDSIPSEPFPCCANSYLLGALAEVHQPEFGPAPPPDNCIVNYARTAVDDVDVIVKRIPLEILFSEDSGDGACDDSLEQVHHGLPMTEVSSVEPTKKLTVSDQNEFVI